VISTSARIGAQFPLLSAGRGGGPFNVLVFSEIHGWNTRGGGGDTVHVLTPSRGQTCRVGERNAADPTPTRTSTGLCTSDTSSRATAPAPPAPFAVAGGLASGARKAHLS